MRCPGLSSRAPAARAARSPSLGCFLRRGSFCGRARAVAELPWVAAPSALPGGGGPRAYPAGRGAALTALGGLSCRASFLAGCP